MAEKAELDPVRNGLEKAEARQTLSQVAHFV